jgi:hypothetical protein
MKDRIAVVLSSLTLFLSACEADVPLPAATAAPSGVHVMPLDGESAADQRSLDTSASPPKLEYFGGPVIAHAKVVVVLWGSGVDAAVRSALPGFFSTVLDSPYIDWLSEYDTVLPGGTNQHIGRGRYGGSVVIDPAHAGTTVDDRDVQAELSAQITAGALPAPDADTIYMTYFPPGTTITEGGDASCEAFCAYHGTFRRSGKSVFYAVVPDMGPGSGCDSGCGSGTAFQNLTSVSSHELVEAITDAEVGIATSVGKPLAWYDPDAGEIGDICNGKAATVSGYTVQKQWDNASSSCIASKEGSGAEIVDGGFEGSLAGWERGGEKPPIDSTAEAHGGTWSLRLGATTTTEPAGDSWASQSLSIPSGSAGTLSFWFFAKSADTIANDWQEATIQDASGATLRTIFHETSNARVWTRQTVDLAPYAGRTITIRFDVHENGGTTPTTLWIDDVSL